MKMGVDMADWMKKHTVICMVNKEMFPEHVQDDILVRKNPLCFKSWPGNLNICALNTIVATTAYTDLVYFYKCALFNSSFNFNGNFCCEKSASVQY